MAVSEAFAGSASIGTTEYSCPNASTTLTPRTEDGAFQVFLDVAAITVTEQYQVRVYEKCRAASSQRVIYEAILTGPMADSYVLPALILMHGWDVTLKKLAGTDRTIEWSIRQG